MWAQKFVTAIDRQRWLDPLGEQLQQGLASTFKAGGAVGQQIKDLLHGTWLGHPLHPAVTDIPVGSWTMALVFDALDLINGDDDYAPAAEVAIWTGLGAAVLAALSGFTDWEHTQGKSRRVGLVHATLNLSAASLYTTSLAARRRDELDTGRALAGLAYSIAIVSAYLGGELVSQLRVGVSHAPIDPPPEEFRPVLAEAELGEGELRRVSVDDIPIMLARYQGQVYALADSCSHMGCSLAEGKLEGASVRCTCHGSRFSLADGRVLDGPASVPEPAYETRLRAGQIELRFSHHQQRSAGA